MKKMSAVRGLSAFIMLACSTAGISQLSAQPLTVAMRALGSQTATNIAFNPDVVSPPATPAIKGTYSPMKALNLLLRGSDLATQIDQRRMFVGLNGSHSQPRSAFVRLLLGT